MNTIIFGLRYELLEPALKRLLVVGHDYLLDLLDMNTCWEMTATCLLTGRHDYLLGVADMEARPEDS